MPSRATIAVLVIMASIGNAVPVHAEDGRQREDRRRRPRAGLSFVIRGPLALTAGTAVTVGAVVWLDAHDDGENSGDGSTAEGLLWISCVSVAVAGAAYAVERPLDGDWRGHFGMAVGGAALGTIVMVVMLATTDSTATGLSLFAPAVGAILGYEMSRRGPAWAALTLDGSKLALGVPLPQPRVLERRGRRDVAFEVSLLQVRF